MMQAAQQHCRDLKEGCGEPATETGGNRRKSSPTPLSEADGAAAIVALLTRHSATERSNGSMSKK
jgi:hypothetical protein